MLVLNLPFKALMFLTLMRPSLVLFLVLWLKLVKDFLKVRCRLALLPFLISCLIWLDLVASLDQKSGSAGMPRPNSYAVFCLKKKTMDYFPAEFDQGHGGHRIHRHLGVGAARFGVLARI